MTQSSYRYVASAAWTNLINSVVQLQLLPTERKSHAAGGQKDGSGDGGEGPGTGVEVQEDDGYLSGIATGDQREQLYRWKYNSIFLYDNDRPRHWQFYLRRPVIPFLQTTLLLPDIHQS